jgi:hypothetical protein
MNSTHKKICAVVIILIVLMIALACTIYYIITSKQITNIIKPTEKECSNELYPHLDSQVEQCAKEKADIIPEPDERRIELHRPEPEPEMKNVNAVEECITQIYPDYKQKIMECTSQLK